MIQNIPLSLKLTKYIFLSGWFRHIFVAAVLNQTQNSFLTNFFDWISISKLSNLKKLVEADHFENNNLIYVSYAGYGVHYSV